RSAGGSNCSVILTCVAMRRKAPECGSVKFLPDCPLSFYHQALRLYHQALRRICKWRQLFVPERVRKLLSLSQHRTHASPAVQKGDYIKMKNAELGLYRVPKAVRLALAGFVAVA